MSTSEFKVGDYVVYGTNGVCRIDCIDTTSLSPFLEPRQYYFLTQVKSGSRIYVPYDSEKPNSKMRRLMTKKDIDMLLLAAKNKTLEWNSDRKVRVNLFHEILSKGLHDELIMMIRCIYMQKNELQKNKKRLSNTDSDMLFYAESVVEDEFSFVLGMPAEKIGSYIKEALGIDDSDYYA